MFLVAVTSFLLLMSVDAKYQEMTHIMDMDTMMSHPNFAAPELQFKYSIGFAGPLEGIKFASFNYFSTVEHMGTHIDAPYHFDQDGKQMHEIPLEDLHGPLVRINIREKTKTNSRAVVEISDLQNWEEKYGQIPERAYILMDSGWHKFWGDRAAYTGTEALDQPTDLAWPGFGLDAVSWLLENRNFLGLGVDTLSCDYSQDIRVHTTMLPQGKFCIENLNNLDKVPENGAEFFAMPLFLKGGTGAQGRFYAFWDDSDMNGLETSAASFWQANVSLIITLRIYLIL